MSTSDNGRLEILPGNNIFHFPGSLSKANSDAAKECHMFALSAANAQHNPFEATREWFENYVQIMKACGWLPISFDLVEVTDSAIELSLSNVLGRGLKAASGLLAGNVPQAMLELGGTIANALASSEQAVQLIKRASTEKDSSGIKLLHIGESASGEVVALVSANQVDADPTVDSDYLVLQWKGSGAKRYSAVAALTLHRGLYEQNRDVLISRTAEGSRRTLLSVPTKP